MPVNYLARTWSSERRAMRRVMASLVAEYHELYSLEVNGGEEPSSCSGISFVILDLVVIDRLVSSDRQYPPPLTSEAWFTSEPVNQVYFISPPFFQCAGQRKILPPGFFVRQL
ncbi:hypothetical protein PAAG_04875 [Paracoccidioides lutzii Pb01]|uniref:Uncharacterized protein n=1 Tax=Paracoccidioides lutzii (strain ATCC MYA-826 / Pb01) TaxID=502779 RepID=C1H1T9_PARBA|nr:hypothetical protein PAAG_04875 [Paracoccidioides lutzii Pb01]EEH33826.2 hypothetical protein PAAG_04875 [Paracoccidioides lutzii Pb01]